MRPLALLAALALAASAAAADPAGAPTTAGVQPAGVPTTAAVSPEAAGTVAGPSPTAVTTTAKARPEMVAIPGGRYTMGATAGLTGDTGQIVLVKPFLLDTTEVTVAAYAECVRAGKCRPAAATIEKKWTKVEAPEVWSSQCNRDRADKADHPVNCVDWDQARAFCAWRGKRLPTSAEWEWAARNGSKATRYPWGKGAAGDRPCWSGKQAGAPETRSWLDRILKPKEDDADEEARSALDGLRDGTCPAGSHPQADTASGLADMAGNVWEWTSSEQLVGADTRGAGGSWLKIARGGGWADRDPAVFGVGRVAQNRADDRGADLGFRCAKDR
jgi:formylglycine-generating enzyme required for sulfatase activity